MNYRQYVSELERKCDVFLEQVATIGNECAWTDCTVEAILAAADNLRKKYYGKSVNTRQGVSNVSLSSAAVGNDYKARVEALKAACEVFRNRVNTCGNECAWTDRALELALDAATVLGAAYRGSEPISREGASIDEQIGAAVALKGTADKETVSPEATEKGGHAHVL